MNAAQQYIDLFRQQRTLIDQHAAPLLNAQRDAALAALEAQGLPTLKQEAYRYTDMQAAFAPDYGVNLSRVEFPVNPYDSFKCAVPNLSTQLYFVVNDQFYTHALPQAQLPEGVIVGSLRTLALEQPELLASYYAELAQPAKDPINALNTMLAQDGLVIYVPRGVRVERTIQVVNILRSDVDLMVNRRVLVILEDGAEAKILFCDHAMDDRPFLSTEVREVFVGENARLELYDLESTHAQNTRVQNTYARLSRYAFANLSAITLTGGLTRNQCVVELCGEYAEASVNGCAVADQAQHTDNNTLIHHIAPHCQSNELYKYVLDDQAVGAFAGLVLVDQAAQKTLSTETNANLCASPTARMFTQPMLEIYADDVKCSHGSTVGQLNEQALFYMRQRGIPEAEARLLLKFAFVAQVLDSIQLEPLRDRLRHLFEQRFRGSLAKCDGCAVCK